MRSSYFTGVFLALTLLTLPVSAQEQPTPGFTPLPSITLPPELDNILRDYEAAWQAGNGKALASLFTSDGFVPIRPGWVQGQEAIESAYENASGQLHLRAVGYAVQDTVGYIIGAYRYGEELVDRGKFILALRRSEGEPWLIAADLDRSN
jgi:hypothetical protein